jgi:hypothetical protein
MDNLLAGIRISSFNEKSQDTLVIPRQLSLSDMHLQGVATFTGMGGSFQTEWVATFHRNRWQPSTGILKFAPYQYNQFVLQDIVVSKH